MAETKYRWLKLPITFFQQKEIKKLRKMAGGDTYTIIYLKMQLLSLKSAGIIFFESVEDSIEEELALELDEAVEDTQMTLLFLRQHGLIEEIQSDEYLLPKAVECMGQESASAERVRRFRERKLLSSGNESPLQCNADVTDSNAGVTQSKSKNKKELLPISDEMSDPTPKKKPRKQYDDSAFNRFWAVYPRKVSKADAVKAWEKLCMNDELLSCILSAVEAAKATVSWQDQGGKFIPYPASWLNGECWTDELQIETTKPIGKEWDSLD